MKITIPLSELEQLIIVDLYYLTYVSKALTPITEKQLRNEMGKKSPLHQTLKRLIEKSYVMRTLKDGKFWYALSPNGAKMLELLRIVGELDIDMTEREKRRWYILNRYNPDYQMRQRKKRKIYITMCCECFSIIYVKEEKIFKNDNLCAVCKVERKKTNS